MSHTQLYKQYLKVLTRYPRETGQFSKPKSKCIATFLEKQSETTYKTTEPIILEKRYRAINDLVENKHLKRYPHQYKSGIMGLTYEQLRIVNSEEFRKKTGLQKDDRSFIEKISSIFRNPFSRQK